MSRDVNNRSCYRSCYRSPPATSFYLQDASKPKGYCQKAKREPKQYFPSGLHQFYYLENPARPKQSRQRSVSPNLPKIPYLERTCQPSPPPYQHVPQRHQKSKFVYKNRHQPAKEPAAATASKKSIPDHCLMKNLLSGLSVFDGATGPPKPHHVGQHKSTGNLNTPTKNEFAVDARQSNPKSNIEFSEVSLRKCADRRDPKDWAGNGHDLDYPGCYDCGRDMGKKCDLRGGRCYVDYNGNNARAQPSAIALQPPERDGHCFGYRFDARFEQDDCKRRERWLRDRRQRDGRSTLVEERRRFFERHQSNLEHQNLSTRIKPSSKAFVVDCVEKHIQNDYSRSEEITELYRNFQSINSTSTLSKRSSSVPPINKCVRRSNSKTVELFNADYNFENKSTNSSCMRKSIIESIRSKVFKSHNSEHDWPTDDWNSNHSAPKFPKETRTAMSIILSNRNSSVSCKLCQERLKTRHVVSIETQTSPAASKHEVFSCCPTYLKIPCTRNLLCNKGLHVGQCEISVERKLDVLCSEGCVCRRHRMMIKHENLVWPAQKYKEPEVEGHDDGCSYALETEPSEDCFLKLIRPDFDSSSDNIPEQGDNSDLNLYPSYTPYTMNGLNGHSNGDLNGCGDIITQNQHRGCWTIGLINSKYRYLTAETFGFKINANGTSLKKKQIWTLEPDSTPGNESFIYLKSHLDKYLAVDSFGNVTCENEEKEAGSKFQITVAEDNTGRWAFRNVVRGYFLGSSSDKLTCTAKIPGDAEFWHIHLAARPQVNLRSIGRKRFAHLSGNLDEIHVDANIPWGEDTLFTLEFHADESGKYALHTCNNKYLSNGGKLVDSCTKDCLFSAEYHSGQLALRDRNGAYLSPIGSKAVLKTRSNSVTKDELFSLEDSLPQASFVAALNARYVSVKQGVDLTANQDEISDHETFQLEFDWSTKRWYIRTMQDKYWTLETGGGIQASGDKRSSNALFDLVWQVNGSLAFRANNGRYVMTKRSGHLYATSEEVDENCKYYFYLINRPILVLKCEQGFVGYKSGSSPKLECNKATYECIQVERAEKGVIYFKGQNGKYWHFDSESVTADSDVPQGFHLELREPTRLCIKTTSGNYLTASKNGMFRIGDSNIENATQWEY